MPTAPSHIREMILASLFAALTAVCSWICVPGPAVVFTMQTFAVFLTLEVLGGKWGTVSILIYLLMGAVGLPVFAGFTGGPGALLGSVTSGYLLGFLVQGLLYWLTTAVAGNGPRARLTGLLLGLLSCYGFGSAWFWLLYLNRGGSMTLRAVILVCVVPYVIPDLGKLALARLVAERLKKRPWQ